VRQSLQVALEKVVPKNDTLTPSNSKNCHYSSNAFRSIQLEPFEKSDYADSIMQVEGFDFLDVYLHD